MEPTKLSKQKVLDEFDLLLTSNEFGLNKKAEEFIFIETRDRSLSSSSTNASSTDGLGSASTTATASTNSTTATSILSTNALPLPSQQQQRQQQQQQQQQPQQVPKSFGSSKVVSLWFLRQITRSNREEGIYLSQHLFLPKNLWETLKVRDTLLRSRIECLATVAKFGQQFLKHRRQEKRTQQKSPTSHTSPTSLQDDSAQREIDALLTDQSVELAKLEQRFHISFIEPLSIVLPHDEKRPMAAKSGSDYTPSAAPALAHGSLSGSQNLLNSAVSRLSIISSNSSFSHSGSSSSQKNNFFFNRKSVSQNSIMSPPTGPGSSPNATIPASKDDGDVSKHHNFQSLNNNHNLPQHHQSAPVGAPLAPYLAALTSLIAVLDALYAREQEIPALQRWVDGYSRFVSRVVCRLILKDILYLIDAYQTQIRDWLLS
jgi:hypothetical protein